MVFVDCQGMSWGSLKLALAGWPYGCNSWCMLWRTVQQRDHVLTLGHTAKLRTKSESITSGSKPGGYKKFQREKLWSEDSPWHRAGLGQQQADWSLLVARICPSSWWGCLFRLYVGNLCQPLSEILDLMREYTDMWEKEENVQDGDGKWIQTVGMEEKHLGFDVVFREA